MLEVGIALENTFLSPLRMSFGLFTGNVRQQVLRNGPAPGWRLDHCLLVFRVGVAVDS